MTTNSYLEKYIKELKQSYYIISSMQDTDSIEKMLSLMLTECLTLIAATSGFVMFRHGQSQKLYVYTSAQIDKNILLNSHLNVGDGITGTVIRDGIPKIINDTTLDPKYIVVDPTTYSELAVPIKINEYTIGALVLDHTKKNAFTDKHLELIQLITSQAGFIISHFLDTAQFKKNTCLLEALLILPNYKSSDDIFSLLSHELNVKGACILNKKGEILFQKGELCSEVKITSELFSSSHSYILSEENEKKVPYTRIIIPRTNGDMTFIADKIYYFAKDSQIDIKFANRLLESLVTKDLKLQDNLYSDNTIAVWANYQIFGVSGQIYDTAISIVERELIKSALKKNKNNRLRTSQFLGINRNTLRHKIEIYNLD